MKKRQIVAMAVMGIMTVACTDYDLNGQTDWQGDELLELSASISETVPTRAEGELAKGTYYFSYIKSNENSYQTIEVNFTEGKDTLTDPTWKDINTNDITNKLFILDNVPYINTNGFTSSSSDENKLIKLQDIKEGINTESRYNAGPAPTIPGGGNDLLWNTVKVENVSGAPLSPVHFDLEHRMSMLTFKLQSKDPGINTLLNDKKNVKVKLHRVITEPYQFNRLTGAIIINSSTKPIEENNAVILDVAEEYTPDKGAITQSWIFPPQEFHKTERPVLAITLTDTENNQTRTFKGVLPESMLYEGKYEPLEFLPGCHLTVTVVLGNWDDLAINFRPVLVKKWVTYSAKDINAKQVGVYTAEELTELVTAYNQDSSEDNLALWKYGVYNNGTWTFDLWKSITETSDSGIIKDGILNFDSEKDDTPFTFNSHGHTINGSGVDNKGQLKVGVVKNEDLTALVEAYNTNPQNSETLKKYGTFNETNSTWTFYLWTNLTEVTGYEDKDNLGFNNSNSQFTFISNGYTINGMHVNTDGSFVGAFDNDDLTALVNAYNQDSQDKETLQKYGTYDGSTWTFYLWKDLENFTSSTDENNLGFNNSSSKFTFISNGHTINGKTVETDGKLTDNSTTDGGE